MELRVVLRLFAAFAAAIAFVPGVGAQALSWQFEQLYSSADGNIQFVVIHEYANQQSQNALAGAQFKSIQTVAEHGHPAGYVATFTFPTDLPSTRTDGKRFLIATRVSQPWELLLRITS